MGVKTTTKLKGIFLLLTISTILSACGPSACGDLIVFLWRFKINDN